MTEKYYAGIGSRETPSEVCEVMTRIAMKLCGLGYTLRSGGAPGADTAFEVGAGTAAQIFVPWMGFNGRTWGIDVGQDPGLRKIAAHHHPKWHSLREPVKCLMTRNSAQIRGRWLDDPLSKFVVCWTRNGEDAGGTSQALRVARSYSVPIFNLGGPNALKTVVDMYVLAHIVAGSSECTQTAAAS